MRTQAFSLHNRKRESLIIVLDDTEGEGGALRKFFERFVAWVFDALNEVFRNRSRSRFGKSIGLAIEREGREIARVY